MKIKAGDVIRVPFHSAKHDKFLICISPDKGRYMVVSSEPYQLAAQAQLQVSASEVPGLDHTSYIDTSKLFWLSKNESQDMIDRDPHRHKGAISSDIRSKIKALVDEHGIMPNDQASLVKTNL